MGTLNLKTIRVIGLDIVRANLAIAGPKILVRNRAMVLEILRHVKVMTAVNTPLGPGHFGYHLRDNFHTDVHSTGLKTVGTLRSPVTGYWREYGTRSRYRGPNKLRRYVQAISISTGGEHPFMTAHKAARGYKVFVATTFGRISSWWGNTLGTKVR